MDNYEDKSDEEINEAVHLAKYKGNISDFDKFFAAFPTRNYCNNPSDAWPIILENRIALIPAFDIWDASKGGFGHDRQRFQVQHTNPFRAAMIVFLKMEQDNEPTS